VVAVALGLLAMVAGCRGSSSTYDPEHPPRVAVFALDAGTWDLLGPYMERGLLPNLQRLRDEGAWGGLKSTRPSNSPVIWTSIATGMKPTKHGITFFLRFPDRDTGKPKPVDRSLRQVKAIWNILGEQGLRVAIVGWFVTWPAEDVNGYVVSDRSHYGRIDQATFPPAFAASLEPVARTEADRAASNFMNLPPADPGSDDAPVASDRATDFLVLDRYTKAYTRDLYYLRAARRILDEGGQPDFFALYLRGTDDVQHGFWKFMEPDGFGYVDPVHVARFGNVIERYWQWVDGEVGEMLARLDANTLVLVVSDHGAGPATGRYTIKTPEYLHLSGAHRDTGILIARGPGIEPGTKVDGASIYDITPTVLHYLGLPVGTDMDGRVLGDLFGPAVPAEVREIASYETGAAPTDAAGRDSDVDDEVLGHLRSLGYID